MSLTQGQLDQLSRYHIQTVRNIQSLPHGTAIAAVYMLLGALPLEEELHKKRLLNSVINNDNECPNIKNSFFFITSNIIEKYGLRSLSQLMCSAYSKLQWKHINLKVVNKYWSRPLISEIKTRKTLKYLSVDNLRIGSTHLVWRSLDSTVSDVRKGITKARILTRTYMLQKNRQSFSGGAVDLVCRHCRPEDKDLLYVQARCPALFEIRDYTVQTLKDVVVRKTNLQTWHSCAKDWSVFLETLVCAETLVKALIERLSRDFS